MNRKIVFLLCLLLSGQIFSQTVQWAVRPTSAKIENYGSLLKVRKNGKCGLIDHNNKEVVPTKYDSITSFQNGYAIVMNLRGGNLKVEGVISEGDYDFQPLTEDVYATSYLWFSEGKMPVKSSSGWGYLGTDGNMTIPCQFQQAYPFREGWASVMIDKKAYYIDQNMDYLSVEAGYGDLVFASTFSGNEAVVYSRNMKGYVINRQGRKIRNYHVKASEVKANKYDHSIGDKAQKFKEEIQKLQQDNHYAVFEEYGKFGYKLGNKVVLPAQLENAEPVRGGYANVRYKGQNGVLHIVDGTFSLELEDTQIDFGPEKTGKGYLTLNVPNALEDAVVRLRITDEHNQDLMVQSNANFGRSRTFSFWPGVRPQTSTSLHCSFEVWNDDLLLWRDNREISYNVEKNIVIDTTVVETRIKPASFVLSKPVARSKRANPKDEFYIAVAVNNNGDVRGDTYVTLYVNGQNIGSKRVSVRGQGTANATFCVPNVKTPRLAKVKAVLKNGRSQEKDIELIPFI